MFCRTIYSFAKRQVIVRYLCTYWEGQVFLHQSSSADAAKVCQLLLEHDETLKRQTHLRKCTIGRALLIFFFFFLILPKNTWQNRPEKRLSLFLLYLIKAGVEFKSNSDALEAVKAGLFIFDVV